MSARRCGEFYWIKWLLVCLAIGGYGYEFDQHAWVVGGISGGVLALYITIVALMRRAGRDQ